jgi:hypothetical protein
MSERPYAPYQTELAYIVAELERETGVGYSERAEEIGRSVAHLMD